MNADDVSGSSTSRRCCQARTHASAGRRRLRRPALRQRIRPLPTTRLDHSASVQRDRSSIFRCNFPLAHFSFILDKKEKKEKKKKNRTERERCWPRSIIVRCQHFATNLRTTSGTNQCVAATTKQASTAAFGVATNRPTIFQL